MHNPMIKTDGQFIIYSMIVPEHEPNPTTAVETKVGTNPAQA
jgi:hypothetical protein